MASSLHRDLLAFLEGQGIPDAQLEKTKGHPRIVFKVHGQRRVYVVPSTTGDCSRTYLNCRAGLRRLLRGGVA